MSGTHRGTVIAGAASALLGVAGAIALVFALTSSSGPPGPGLGSRAAPPASPSAAGPTPRAPSSAAPTDPGRPSRLPSTAATIGPAAPPPEHGLVLDRSTPVELDIPAIDVRSPLLQLGLNPDQTVQVPPLNEKDSHAGWYKYSPTPGQLGPSVILGHVDSAEYGPAVFYRLGTLTPGDTIEVVRADGTVAVFSVDRVAEFSKDRFPTAQVYGDIDHAGLRLITCGGHFDFSAGSYDDNVVVFASLVSAHADN